MNKITLFFLFFFSFTIIFAQKNSFKKPNTLMPNSIENSSNLQELHRAFLPNKNKITKKNILTTGTVVDSAIMIGNDNDIGEDTTKYIYKYNSNGKIILLINQKLSNNEWINFSQLIYNYDDKNNLTLLTLRYWKNEAWVNHYKEILEYDNRNNLTLKISQYWANEIWVNQSKEISEYDDRNNLTLEISQYWANETWVNQNKEISEYDDRNNLTLEISQYWADEAWVNHRKWISEYDDRNNLTLYIYQNWAEEAWVNQSKEISEYDDRNNLTLKISQNWANETWVKSAKDTYAYDDRNNLTLYIYQYWKNEAWVNSAKKTYAYDDRNNLTLEIYQDWTDEEWVNNNEKKYKYDSNSNITDFFSDNYYIHTEFQDVFDNAYFFEGNEGYIYYKTITDIKEEKALVTEFMLKQNYPNPFNPSTTINYTISAASAIVKSNRVTLKIYDVLGRKIKTLVNKIQNPGNYSIKFNAANLPSGIYYYKLTTGSFSETKKMILLK